MFSKIILIKKIKIMKFFKNNWIALVAVAIALIALNMQYKTKKRIDKLHPATPASATNNQTTANTLLS